jgi:transcriptional regulator with XRE-family HTH domain
MKRGVRTDGKRMVLLRQESGWTQEQLAHKCDLAVNTIRSAEHGGPVDVTVLNDIARLLKTSVKELLARSNAPGRGKAEPRRAALQDEWFDKLVGHWSGMIEQPTGPDGRHFSAPIRLELERLGATLAGRSHFAFAGTTHTCRLEVQWLFERYFKFDGVSADLQGCMFNTFYFQINPAGDRICGRYIGFGPHTNGIIVGEASGAKVEAAAERGT